MPIKLSALSLVLLLVVFFQPCSILAKKTIPLKPKTIMRVGQTAVHEADGGMASGLTGFTAEKGDKSAIKIKMKMGPGEGLQRAVAINHYCTALRPTAFVGLKATYHLSGSLVKRYKIKIVPRDSMLSDEVFKTIRVPLQLSGPVKSPKKIVLLSKDKRRFFLTVPPKLYPKVRQMKRGRFYNVGLKVLSVVSKSKIRGSMVSIKIGASPRAIRR